MSKERIRNLKKADIELHANVDEKTIKNLEAAIRYYQITKQEVDKEFIKSSMDFFRDVHNRPGFFKVLNLGAFEEGIDIKKVVELFKISPDLECFLNIGRAITFSSILTKITFDGERDNTIGHAILQNINDEMCKYLEKQGLDIARLTINDDGSKPSYAEKHNCLIKFKQEFIRRVQEANVDELNQVVNNYIEDLKTDPISVRNGTTKIIKEKRPKSAKDQQAENANQIAADEAREKAAEDREKRAKAAEDRQKAAEEEARKAAEEAESNKQRAEEEARKAADEAQQKAAEEEARKAPDEAKQKAEEIAKAAEEDILKEISDHDLIKKYKNGKMTFNDINQFYTVFAEEFPEYMEVILKKISNNLIKKYKSKQMTLADINIYDDTIKFLQELSEESEINKVISKIISTIKENKKETLKGLLEEYSSLDQDHKSEDYKKHKEIRRELLLEYKKERSILSAVGDFFKSIGNEIRKLFYEKTEDWKVINQKNHESARNHDVDYDKSTFRDKKFKYSYVKKYNKEQAEKKQQNNQSI